MTTTDKLTDEAAPDYKGFTEAIMENWAAHGDIDAGEKFDLSVKFNILRPILGGYDPEKHSCEWCDADKGDPWYEMNRRASQAAPAPSDALREAARLKWRGDEFHLVENAEASAHTPFGPYYAYKHGFWGPGIIISTGCVDLDAAKAAAEEHYRFALRAALSTPTEERQ